MSCLNVPDNAGDRWKREGKEDIHWSCDDSKANIFNCAKRGIDQPFMDILNTQQYSRSTNLILTAGNWLYCNQIILFWKSNQC